MLTHEGILLRDQKVIAKAKRELTVTPIDRSGLNRFPKRIPVWWETQVGIHVPRFWAAEHGITPMHTSTVTRLHNAAFQGHLMESLEQPQATDAVLRALQTRGGAVLSLGTGCGKTTCACYIISKIQVKTVVVVHKDVLKTQWAERIHQFLPHLKVSFVQGTTVDMSGDIVIAMLQTLIMPHKNIDFTSCGMVVVDECHHIAAETFSTAMRRLACPYSLGLSATPERKDGLTKIIHWFLGDMAFASTRKDQSHVSVEYVRYSCDAYSAPPPVNKFGTVNYTQMISDLTDDTTRTRLIVEYVNRIREDPERYVLVLTHRRDHCTEVAAQIPGAVAFVGSKRKKDISTEHTTAPVVVATYSIASEGYDDARLNTLVLATPVSDVTQAMGRVLRGVSTKPPVIIDIMDDYGVFYAQAAKRKSAYRKAGFKVTKEYEKKYPTCLIID